MRHALVAVTLGPFAAGLRSGSWHSADGVASLPRLTAYPFGDKSWYQITLEPWNDPTILVPTLWRTCGSRGVCLYVRNPNQSHRGRTKFRQECGHDRDLPFQ